MKQHLNKIVSIEVSKSDNSNNHIGGIEYDNIVGELTSIQDLTITLFIEGYGEREDTLKVVQKTDIVTITQYDDSAVTVAKNLYKIGVMSRTEYTRILKENGVGGEIEMTEKVAA